MALTGARQALVITCQNCSCRREIHTFAKSLHPFPGIDTYSQFNPNLHYRHPKFNSTITSSTAFGARLDFPPLHSLRPPAPCFIHVKHAPAGYGLSAEFRKRSCHKGNVTASLALPAAWCHERRNDSRVRIDSLNAYTSYTLSMNATSDENKQATLSMEKPGPG